MVIPPDAVISERLAEQNAEIHSLKVNAQRTVLVYDASYGAHAGPIRSIPALFVILCISGGGRVVQKTTMQNFDSHIEPGDIGIVAPSAPGMGEWPELRTVTMGILVDELSESFGDNWPRLIRSDVISGPIRDTMVETLMTHVGYTLAGRVSDKVLLHAAYMVAHHLLDEVGEENGEIASSVTPLSMTSLERIAGYVAENLERRIPVDDLARIAGVSRHHFSRRFKAATGHTPYQFVVATKLDRAASVLAEDRNVSVTHVSNSFGYDNPAQFAKAFRRRFGASPRIWRSLRN